jgi:hypothetical protein
VERQDAVSLHDVIESAAVWFEALKASEEASEAFRNRLETGTYARLELAGRMEKEARLRHLAAVKDMPSDGVADAVRIDRLRIENERLHGMVKGLRYQVTQARENNEERNRELDTLHYVWCDGGCQGGTHRYCGSPDDVTEEVVATAEAWVKRLRRWYESRKVKQAREKASEEQGSDV